jgi:hypothetical protein
VIANSKVATSGIAKNLVLKVANPFATAASSLNEFGEV